MTYAIYATHEEAVSNLPSTPGAGDTYRQQARGHLRSMYESEERSDTDGFLSQFCSGLNASKADAQARLADNGGMAVFRVLVDATTGELVSTKLYELANRFAGFGFVFKWRVVRNGEVEWVTDYKRATSYNDKNLRVAYMVAPAYASLDSGLEFSQREKGRGMSGMSNVGVTIRMDRKKAGVTV